ncbi:hypothetical protein EZJ55_00140 [Microcystis aeruginosa EAWAG127a]|uniref:Uncharacterized protein n=1 Tax=Microcystis aeruginosa EAWAG127a TaxID=2529855 RepID=A0A5J5M0F2_MICAE|nr:hypothetical protein [Microcystis aeruginosa]KAB0243991.1 hypothetical protein EZJ55_00140 [Microcystis aeruginosa EAWAG127a]
MPHQFAGHSLKRIGNLAEKAENEALKQWLPEFIDSLQGKGYLSLIMVILSISFVDERFLAIINEAAKVIFLSATDRSKTFEARTGLKIDLITTGGIPENIRFIQVSDLGRNGISRGNQQKRMVKAILDYYRQDDPDNTAFIRFQSHCKDDGDETSPKTFCQFSGNECDRWWLPV